MVANPSKISGIPIRRCQRSSSLPSHPPRIKSKVSSPIPARLETPPAESIRRGSAMAYREMINQIPSHPRASTAAKHGVVEMGWEADMSWSCVEGGNRYGWYCVVVALRPASTALAESPGKLTGIFPGPQTCMKKIAISPPLVSTPTVPPSDSLWLSIPVATYHDPSLNVKRWYPGGKGSAAMVGFNAASSRRIRSPALADPSPAGGASEWQHARARQRAGAARMKLIFGTDMAKTFQSRSQSDRFLHSEQVQTNPWESRPWRG